MEAGVEEKEKRKKKRKKHFFSSFKYEPYIDNMEVVSTSQSRYF